ncbi:MAG: AsmA family protein, partial [Microthrixaceae bacterium]
MRSVARAQPWIRRSASIVAVLLVAAVCASCAPSGPSGPSGPGAVERFCELWDAVAEEPPAPDQPVAASLGVLAYAEDTEVIGGDCEQPGAQLDLDTVVLADAAVVGSTPAVEFDDDPELGAAMADAAAARTEAALDADPVEGSRAFVNREDLGPGQLVLESVAVSNLSASISASGIRLSGNVAVRLSGVTSTIGFVGTMSSLDNWSVRLASSSLTIPGVTSTPVVFDGTLRMSNGEPSLFLSARAAAATIDDITVHQATISFAASRSAGVAASVSGSIRIGASTVNGSVHASFDRRGNLVATEADLWTRVAGISLGGGSIDLQGQVRLDGTADATTVAFSGSGVVDGLIVHAANGELELGPDSTRFTGLLDIDHGGDVVRFDGAIVWDGQVAHVERLELEADGDISGTLPNGQQVTADGALEVAVVDGEPRTVVRGDFTIGSLKASGWATVDVVGPTTMLDVSAVLDLDGSGAHTAIEGVVEITDGRVQRVQIDGAVTADQVSIGDLTLGSSTLRIRSETGGPLEVSWSGSLKIGERAALEGELDVAVGPTGNLMRLEGEVHGRFDLDAVTVHASVVDISATSGELTANLERATVEMPGAEITLSGSFASSLGTADWILQGSGVLEWKVLNIKLRKVVVTPKDGMVS